MFGGKGGLAGLMKQAQEIQEKMKQAQEAIANMEVTGEAGGGMVKVTMTGKHELVRVQIDDSLMDDKEMLEDLIAAAVNSAVRNVEEETSARMSEVTGGLNLPGGLQFPF
jgi:DNA-binding YbaB/EbfC family protein